ncbi:MAG: BatA domain-containing protein [Planctomycetaceae bacterium]|nr:BatA domain-containing protein [Planctomycetaceae bacterium]
MFVASFAVAGAVAASAPLIIHLLNRRRFKTVEWAAMDFLRQAVRRNRRILHLRDLLLLALRTLCVLLFGLAMARPYLQLSGASLDPNQPVHAIVALDNSLSMSYQRIDGTLLDEAKQRAREYLEQLPTGSRYTILPMCAFAGEFAIEPYRTREDALEALDAVVTVDRAVSMPAVFDLVRDAAQRAPDLPAKRVVAIGDQQQHNWPQTAFERVAEQGFDVQVVRVSAERPDNAWIADFRVVDALADIETATVFNAVLGFDGPEPRSNVQVTLQIDGAPVASRTVDLEPGQTREVSFSHRLELTVEPGKANYVTAEVTIPPDRLSIDDRRSLVVPVVAALPVVFVDELGDTESPAALQYGETYRWRRLLAPITSRGESGRQLIAVRHLRIDEVTRETLKDSRLVVIAGVESPAESVPVLREFVEQGGQLVIAAGGKFDASVWSEQAWLDGNGVLPLPLKSEYVGVTPDEAGDQLQPFFLEAASLVHDYFQIENLSTDERADLFRQALFFKSAVVDADDQRAEQVVIVEQERLAKQRETVKRAREPTSAKAPLVAENAPRRDWLLWTDRSSDNQQEAPTPAIAAAKLRPRVIAKYTNDLPYLVERDIGHGHVLFVASGVGSAWNTLMTTHAALLFDRIFRARIEATLPTRNFGAIEQIVLPVEARERQQRFTLVRPGKGDEPLFVDALGGEAYALPLRHLESRGIYRVRAQRPGVADGDDKLWELALAVNGPADESQLKSLTPAAFAERAGERPLRWIDRGESISLAGAAIYGQDWWRWLMLAVLACLLVELVVLAWTHRATARVAVGGAA